MDGIVRWRLALDSSDPPRHNVTPFAPGERTKRAGGDKRAE